jgi:hypothetical protein
VRACSRVLLVIMMLNPLACGMWLQACCVRGSMKNFFLKPGVCCEHGPCPLALWGLMLHTYTQREKLVFCVTARI